MSSSGNKTSADGAAAGGNMTGGNLTDAGAPTGGCASTVLPRLIRNHASAIEHVVDFI
jgi:hypothetical protein